MESIVSQKDTIPELDGCKIVDISKLSFDHCPIIDCGVTDDSKVLALAQKLTKDISEGEVIYLHCWGGHGRTGTVVCIMLYLLYGVSAILFFGLQIFLFYGRVFFFHRVYHNWIRQLYHPVLTNSLHLLLQMNPKQAFDYCQAVHDLRTCPVEVGSPQTQTQRQQVVRVINLLMHEYEVRKARHHEEASVRRLHAQKQLEAEHALALKAAANTSVCCGEATELNNNKPTSAQHVASPPMKPNLVVRDTTQEHSFAMEKNHHGMNITGASASLTYNPKLGRKVHNTHTTQSAQNGHNGHSALAAPPSSAPSKSTSLLPVIQSKNTSTFASASPAPMTNSTVSASTESYDGTHSLSSTPNKNPPPTGISLSENGALGLLQSLQAHPPRNPPPHNSRTEGLQKLHSRGASATACSASAGELHAHEVYVPRSSDEGESTNDEDESGFLMVASTGTGRIPLHTGTSRTLDQMHIQVSDLDYPNSPMEISPSVMSATSGMGYISSSSASAVSRPSTVQDSPMAGGDQMDLVLEHEPNTTTGISLPAAVITTSVSNDNVQLEKLQHPTLETEESNLDDQALRPPSAADSPVSRSQSTESTPKARRLSGKSITNVFKAGIKIFTGGSTPRKKDATGPNGSQAGSTADGSDLLKQSLKTASTESTTYSSGGYSPPPSTATTPTTQHLYQHQQQHQQQQHAQPHHQGSVDPTPPKGTAPTARPHHSAHPAHAK